MTIEEIHAYVESLGKVLTLRPGPGDGSPDVVWGDLFFYYAPDGVVPRGQPFATIVTKDYPGEPSSRLGHGVFRLSIAAGRRSQPSCTDPTRRDEVLPHPVYRRHGWVCIVRPGPHTEDELRLLLRQAHDAAERRWSRRHQG